MHAQMKWLEKRPFVVLVTGIFGIALSSILVRFSEAPPVVTAVWRLLWAVMLLTPIVLGKQSVRAELRNLDAKTVLKSCISGICLAVHFALWFASLQHTTVAASTTIVCTEVIWVAIGYCLFQKGRLTWQMILAIVITLTGSVMIAITDLRAGKLHLYGDLLALVAAMVEAGHTLIGKRIRKTVSTTVYTFMVYTSGTALLLLSCLVQKQSLVGYGNSVVIVGLLLAVFSTLLGHSSFSWCLRFFSPSFVSASKLCEPVVAAVVAAFLFGEIPGPWLILGGIVILAGVFYYSQIERKTEEQT